MELALQQFDNSIDHGDCTEKDSIELAWDLTELWRAIQCVHVLWQLWILAISMAKIGVC